MFVFKTALFFHDHEKLLTTDIDRIQGFHLDRCRFYPLQYVVGTYLLSL